MLAIPQMRRPGAIHTTDQIVAQAARLGSPSASRKGTWSARNAARSSGCTRRTRDGAVRRAMAGVWFRHRRGLRAHQRAMRVVPHGKFARRWRCRRWPAAGSTSARTSAWSMPRRADDPAHQRAAMGRLPALRLGVVGESSCADSWGRAGWPPARPACPSPCYAERRCGGVPDDELLMALPPTDLLKGHRGHAGAGRRTGCATDPSWHPGRCARRPGRQLPADGG